MRSAVHLVSRSATISLLLLFPACGKKNKAGDPAAADAASTTTTSATVEDGGGQAPADPSAAADGRPVEPGKLALTWKGVGLSTPGAVVYDDVNDVYLVSNVDGRPLDPDGTGFISKLSPDGSVAKLKWIESGRNNVLLNAPKGLALAGDRLYVADIDTIRIFNRKTGAQVGNLRVYEASFLDDIALGPDGRLFVSDTGLRADPQGLVRSGTDAVYAITPGKKMKDKPKIGIVAKSHYLEGPRGILASKDKTWIATFGANKVFAIDSKGMMSDVQSLPNGLLGGMTFVGDDILVSSWAANAIYRGKPGQKFSVVIPDVKSPANLAYDTKRGRVLVPLFSDHEVRAYDLK
jgi:hypothetical protein